MNRRDLLRGLGALSVASGVGAAVAPAARAAGQTAGGAGASGTTRFFPGFKAFKVQTSGAVINGVGC